MKKRKLLLPLSFVMMVLSVVPLGGVPDVRAKEITSKIVLEDNVDSFADIEVEKNIESYESLKIAGISDAPMETESIDGMKYNEIERPYSGENYTIGESAGLYSESRYASDNTNPNNAYIVENDSVVQGTMEQKVEWNGMYFHLVKKVK